MYTLIQPEYPELVKSCINTNKKMPLVKPALSKDSLLLVTTWVNISFYNKTSTIQAQLCNELFTFISSVRFFRISTNSVWITLRSEGFKLTGLYRLWNQLRSALTQPNSSKHFVKVSGKVRWRIMLKIYIINVTFSFNIPIRRGD